MPYYSDDIVDASMEEGQVYFEPPSSLDKIA